MTLAQKRVHERGFAVVNVGDDGDITDVHNSIYDADITDVAKRIWRMTIDWPNPLYPPGGIRRSASF